MCGELSIIKTSVGLSTSVFALTDYVDGSISNSFDELWEPSYNCIVVEVA